MAVNHALTLRGLDEDATVRAILEGTATETGERFFAALVENLSRALNTYSSWVTEYIEESRQLHALAFWVNGQLAQDFYIDIAGTPCETVIESARLVHYPDNMTELFPNSSTVKEFSAVSYMGVPLIDSRGRILGNLAVLDNRPMPEEPRSQALFRIFAARAAAELQRIYAEAEIRKREEKYRRIVETAGEGFILMDKNLIITDVNEALCQLVGVRREEIIGRTPLEFATEEFRQFMETNQKEISSGKYKEFEGTVASKNGQDIPVLVHGSTLRDDQGHIIGNMAFVTNLSEQKKSLTLAGEVQKSLQPQNSLQVQGLDVAGRTIACDEIGGDYFDFLQEQECANNHFDAVVGDVTGHGVDAALLMTTARAFLRIRASQCGSISQIITEMNHRLALDFLNTGRFMTLFYLSIDPESRSLRWVRAGHDAAVIYDPVMDNFEELMGSGLALGVDQNFAYEEYLRTGLCEGQIIAIGTDGIWEACNRDGEMFGKKRFHEIIRENAHRSARQIIDTVYNDLNRFKSGLKQADDITLVVIKLNDLPGAVDDWQI
ncbi:MAG: SpoIIE family protein phosphatase [Desulfobacterales bacterium]|nr:MAG: SpoIIE family protein phosphatase [Desulfobacterales bacterium]